MVLGVSGRYCAGKSEVSRILLDHGYTRVDVDRYGHDALRSERDRIVAAFGKEILEEGEIDRRKLGGIVFENPDARKRLEEIVHPVMRERVAEDAERSRRDGTRLVIDAALLFYMRLHTVCETVIWVDAPAPLRLFRALKRDKLSFRQLLTRFRAQGHISPQPYEEDVDIRRVNNWGSRDRLKKQVAEIPGVLPER